MNRRFSQAMAARLEAYTRTVIACKQLSKETVQGSFEGITVTYNGVGVVERILVDPEKCSRLYLPDTVPKKLNLPYLEAGVAEAVVDANAKMNDRKIRVWREVDPRQDLEPGMNRPPFPFDAENLEALPDRLDVSHLPDGLLNKQSAESYDRERTSRMEKESKEVLRELEAMAKRKPGGGRRGGGGGQRPPKK